MVDNNSVYPMEKRAKVNGLDMRYLDWGGEGEPMLALHGLASSANWYDIVARLLRDRYRIIATPTSGATARPPRRAQATTGIRYRTTWWRCWTTWGQRFRASGSRW